MVPTRPGPDRREELVRAAFGRLDVTALAVAMGCLWAAALGASTAWLLLAGAPPGVPIGPRLGLLGHFLPGYTVTWPGAALGAAYGFVLGFGVGGVIGTAWDLAHHLYLMLAGARRAQRSLGLDA